MAKRQKWQKDKNGKKTKMAKRQKWQKDKNINKKLNLLIILYKLIIQLPINYLQKLFYIL